MKCLVMSGLMMGLLIGCQTAQQPAPSRSDSTLGAPATQPNVLAHPEDVQPSTGHACRVYLRRDALGIPGAATPGAALEIPLQHGTVVGGSLEQVTDAWLVLRTDSGRLWIPRAMVLMVELFDR